MAVLGGTCTVMGGGHGNSTAERLAVVPFVAWGK